MPSIEQDPLVKLATQYYERFGHLVPRSALESMPEPELVKAIKEALASGSPVPGWADEPFGSRQPSTVPDSGPDSEMRGWQQHLKQGKPKG